MSSRGVAPGPTWPNDISSSTRRYSMATVLLAGAYGQCNPGDEALLSAFLRALPQHRVIATSADPAGTMATHGCEAVSSFDRSAIFRALFVADSVVMGGG